MIGLAGRPVNNAHSCRDLEKFSRTCPIAHTKARSNTGSAGISAPSGNCDFSAPCEQKSRPPIQRASPLLPRTTPDQEALERAPIPALMQGGDGAEFAMS